MEWKEASLSFSLSLMVIPIFSTLPSRRHYFVSPKRSQSRSKSPDFKYKKAIDLKKFKNKNKNKMAALQVKDKYCLYGTKYYDRCRCNTCVHMNYEQQCMDEGIPADACPCLMCKFVAQHDMTLEHGGLRRRSTNHHLACDCHCCGIKSFGTFQSFNPGECECPKCLFKMYGADGANGESLAPKDDVKTESAASSPIDGAKTGSASAPMESDESESAPLPPPPEPMESNGSESALPPAPIEAALAETTPVKKKTPPQPVYVNGEARDPFNPSYPYDFQWPYGLDPEFHDDLANSDPTHRRWCGICRQRFNLAKPDVHPPPEVVPMLRAPAPGEFHFKLPPPEPVLMQGELRDPYFPHLFPFDESFVWSHSPDWHRELTRRDSNHPQSCYHCLTVNAPSPGKLTVHAGIFDEQPHEYHSVQDPKWPQIIYFKCALHSTCDVYSINNSDNPHFKNVYHVPSTKCLPCLTSNQMNKETQKCLTDLPVEIVHLVNKRRKDIKVGPGHVDEDLDLTEENHSRYCFQYCSCTLCGAYKINLIKEEMAEGRKSLEQNFKSAVTIDPPTPSLHERLLNRVTADPTHGFHVVRDNVNPFLLHWRQGPRCGVCKPCQAFSFLETIECNRVYTLRDNAKYNKNRTKFHKLKVVKSQANEDVTFLLCLRPGCTCIDAPSPQLLSQLVLEEKKSKLEDDDDTDSDISCDGDSKCDCENCVEADADKAAADKAAAAATASTSAAAAVSNEIGVVVDGLADAIASKDLINDLEIPIESEVIVESRVEDQRRCVACNGFATPDDSWCPWCVASPGVEGYGDLNEMTTNEEAKTKDEGFEEAMDEGPIVGRDVFMGAEAASSNELDLTDESRVEKLQEKNDGDDDLYSDLLF